MIHLPAYIRKMPLHPAIVHFPIALLITASMASVIFFYSIVQNSLNK